MDPSDDITDEPSCAACFLLNAAAAVEYDNPDIIINQQTLAVVAARSLERFQTTAGSGCQPCKLLLKIMDFFGLDPESGIDLRNIILCLPIQSGNAEISFPVDGTKIHVQLYTSSGVTWNQIRPLPEVCADQLSSNGLSFMKGCLQTCLQTHQLCHQNEGKLPTRLLDVGLRGDNLVRLIETGTAVSTDYIALSYCWGNAVGIRTTFATLDSMKSGVQVSGLPQTYIDAITLARDLGVRYLWIDSLCIIQDCFEDWEKESSIMGGIYSKALLTIAAASSSSATQPFLRRNLPNRAESPKVLKKVFTQQINDTVVVNARVITESGVHWKWQDSVPQSAPEPLSRRGWTLQERLLSTRLLSISETEMQWTCEELVTCECQSRLNYRRDFGGKPPRQITRAEDAYNFWHKVVESYSNRELTEPKDKIPAISAIAEVVLQKTGSDYAAGLWAQNIHLDLLWRRCSPIVRPSYPDFIAPTFSWASIDGEVDYYCFRNGKKPYVAFSSVLAIEISVSPNAPLGRIGNGSLTIRGPLISGYVEKSLIDGWTVVKFGSVRVELYSDTTLQEFITTATDGTIQKSACRWSSLNKAPELWKIERDSPKPADSLQLDPKVEYHDHHARCWVLILGSFTSPPDHELLILGKSVTQPDAYERIGLVSSRLPRSNLFQQDVLTTVTLV